jgi:hypothetical protein
VRYIVRVVKDDDVEGEISSFYGPIDYHRQALVLAETYSTMAGTEAYVEELKPSLFEL